MSDLRDTLRPGDIINTAGMGKSHGKWSLKGWIEGLGIKAAVGIIVDTQADMFGAKIPPEKVPGHLDSHSMMFFGPDKVFSVEPPVPLYVPLSNYEGDDPRTVSVYRMNPAYFGREPDVALLRQAADAIINRHKGYDIGQLVDILITSIAGYPWAHKVNWFDQGSQRLVCSVGVASLIAFWRHEMKRLQGIDIPQPWKKLNPAAWPEGALKQYPGHWEIESTFPANYSTTFTHFSHEFTLVGKFRGGKRI